MANATPVLFSGSGAAPPGVGPITPNSAHTTIVSIGVMLLVLVILVEIAGANHEAALGVGALLFSAILIAGFKIGPAKLNTIASYPASTPQGAG